MKRGICVLLLGLLLLCVPARAAGGGDDPLISRSYAEGTFLTQVRSGLQAAAERFLKDYMSDLPAARAGLKTVTLETGDTVRLGAGQQLTLLSGSLRLQLERGTMLNVTQGRVSTGGDAKVANRYVLRGDSAATATATGPAVVTVSAGAQVRADPSTPGACPFTDVEVGSWYYADVVSAYERELVSGMTETEFAPQGKLTAAQGLKLAACMHQLYHDGQVSLKAATDGPWYQTYADYALREGIAEALPTDYNAAMTRAEFIKLFYNALPEKEYARQNLIMDGAIPDVATDAPLARQVYTFYRAGILAGYTASETYLEHAFGPESSITRAEVACIMNRMLTTSARVQFTMD